MSNNIYNTSGGKIEIRHGKRGLGIWSYNFEHEKLLHIGSIVGQTYEKGNGCIVQKPEPSICLKRSEFVAAVENGALFLCVLPRGGGTFSISLVDFNAKHQSYNNDRYGPQMRVPLTAFVYSFEKRKRNPILDNPKPSRPGEIIRQLGMFGAGK